MSLASRRNASRPRKNTRCPPSPHVLSTYTAHLRYFCPQAVKGSYVVTPETLSCAKKKMVVMVSTPSFIDCMASKHIACCEEE